MKSYLMVYVESALNRSCHRLSRVELNILFPGRPLSQEHSLPPSCGLSGYLERYQKRRGDTASDHPESVATTFSLSFEKVENANKAAAELLKFCALLYPDHIPEELFSEGVAELGTILQSFAADPLLLDESIRELLKYSLV
jgi:hypothetical protein